MKAGERRPSGPAGVAALAAQIKQQIMQGVLAPGQRLVEADLSRETGASRAKVREALRVLSVEGIVAIEPFRGATVRKLSREEVLEIGRAREALEGLAARLLAERITPKQAAALKALQGELDAAAEAHRYDLYLTLNDRWHRFIFEACGNPFVAEFVDRLRVPTFPLQYRYMYVDPQFLEGNREHARIVAAILARDPERAESEMRSHVARGSAVLVERDQAEKTAAAASGASARASRRSPQARASRGG